MNRHRVAVLVTLAALGCAHAPGGAPAARSAPACNLGALSAAEREESQRLRQSLGAAVTGMEELPDGFAFGLDAKKLPPASLFRWVDLERRCCPFFRFAIEIAPDTASTSLRLTGGAEVKDFIRSELGK
jgi:hypothetical protein